MINRDKKTVSVVSFTAGTDTYGQIRKGTTTTRSAEMTVWIYSQSNVSDIRFNDVELIGITKDGSISDQNQIVIDNVNYCVLFTIPSRRYNQVFMKKV